MLPSVTSALGLIVVSEVVQRRITLRSMLARIRTVCRLPTKLDLFLSLALNECTGS